MSANLKQFVYFIKPVGLPGPFKIGVSSTPKDRLRVFATWSPLPLEIVATVPGTIQDETYLHSCFADSHLHFEWFEATPALLACVAEIQSGAMVSDLKGRLEKKGSVISKKRKSVKLPGARRSPPPNLQIGYPAYSRRVWWEAKTQGEPEPAAVAAIMDRWAGDRSLGINPVKPSRAELATLDQYLAVQKLARAA